MTLCRSLLFAPANHARRVEKALTLAADAVILDLEDAVAVAEKPAARQAVLAALARPRRCRFYVRVNAMGTEWGYADLVGVVVPGVDGIVLPKLESAPVGKLAERHVPDDHLLPAPCCRNLSLEDGARHPCDILALRTTARIATLACPESRPLRWASVSDLMLAGSPVRALPGR
jgi:hypothetical protein